MWTVDCLELGGDPAFAGHDKRSVSFNIVGVQAEKVSRWSCEEVSPSVLCTVHQYGTWSAEKLKMDPWGMEALWPRLCHSQPSL
jgi:hypothetical protein